MISANVAANAIARWNALSPAAQAAITATPDYYEAMKVLKMQHENDPGAGKAAFEAIGDVAVGAIVGGIVGGVLGGGLPGSIAGGYIGGKIGEKNWRVRLG
ncbi:MAG: hypothetical protein RBT53_03555 [Azonexus sp.]|jgi:hypothetical protein|nr:hypothetical protein [Azonexus sp.]